MYVYVCPKSYKFIEYILKNPPEICGNMDVYFKADAYYLTNFIEEYFSKSGASCIPHARFGRFGIWHTHPSNMPFASNIDYETMKKDLISSVKGDTPGVPPINLIASLVNGKPEMTVYIPSFKVEMKKYKVPYMLEDVSMNFSYPKILEDKKYFYHYYFLDVIEDVDPISNHNFYRVRFVEPSKSNIKNSDGVFIGSRVPVHLVPVLIVYYLINKGSSFFILYENDGLYSVRVETYDAYFEEVKPKVGKLSYGYEQRLEKLSEYGFNLSRYHKKYKIALFGAGFLGGNILSLVAKYFGEIVLVDDDIVGDENIGYQEFFTIEDVGLEKSNVLAKKIEELHPQTKVYGIKTTVPDFDEVCSKEIIADIVRWADIIITAFDTIHPRLTLQVLCSKYMKPLIDAGVGVNDLTIRTWLPNTDCACIGCYTLFVGKSHRTVYASNPATSKAAASIITQLCLNIADGKSVPNIIEFDLDKMDLRVNNWKKNTECPFCSEVIKLRILSNKRYIIEGKWNRETRISDFESELMSYSKIKEVRYLMKNEFVDLPKNKNLIYLKFLERYGLRVKVTL